MPICRDCKGKFEGPYRARYCSSKCQLMSRVQKSDDGCWRWTGAIGGHGYGVLNVGGLDLAHRVAYQSFIGEIPDGAHVLHACDNRACVNPEHLFAGSHADNMQDMAKKGRAAWAKNKMPTEVRQKIAITKKVNAKPNSEAQKRAASATLKALWETKEFQNKVIRSGARNHAYGKPMSAEQRERLRPYWESGSARGRRHSEATKEKMRLAHKTRHAQKLLAGDDWRNV